jgi:hypothetical protein
LEGVSIADWNADGIPDLIVPIYGKEDVTHNVSVFPGNGDGTFGTNTDYPVGGNPSWAALADFNGDGLLDMAALSTEYPDTVTIILQERGVSATATGVAVFPTGTHPVEASYPGDTPHAASVSTTVNLTGTAVSSTTTALTISPNPAAPGASITFSATISPPPTGQMLGTVNFYSGSNLLGMGDVNSSGVATLTGSIATAGTYSITAVYSGTYGFLTSTSSGVSLVVSSSQGGGTATTTTLNISPDPASAGQTVTLTATVSPTPTGSPLGTISFESGSTLGTVAVNSSGVATVTTAAPQTAGNYTITAVYSGNASFAASTSSDFTETVGETAGYSVTASQTPVTVAPGGEAVYHITVPPVGGAFDNQVTMSASGLPAGAMAKFSPAAVVPGTAGAPTTLTVTTAGQSAALQPRPENRHQPRFPFSSLTLAAGVLLVAGNRKRLAKSVPMLVALAMLAAGTLALTGCNGGFQGANPTKYVITVTGTSGAQHASTTVILIVQ